VLAGPPYRPRRNAADGLAAAELEEHQGIGAQRLDDPGRDLQTTRSRRPGPPFEMLRAQTHRKRAADLQPRRRRQAHAILEHQDGAVAVRHHSNRDEIHHRRADKANHKAEVIEKLRKGTDSDAVNKISWTGRWVEPNSAFAAGNVGMYHAHSSAFFVLRGSANWPVNEETLGIGHLPGFFSTPNSHGLAISKGAKNPELAWDFIKMITDARWTAELTDMRKVLTGNTASDEAGLAKLRKEDPLAAQVLQTQIEHTDKLVATWPLAKDAQVKDIFYPELQSALLGRKEPKAMLADAEHGINRLLARHG
jgi:Bacterial extracellular solute-binding protein